MKIKKCSVNNFGSYRSFTFDFSNKGLTVINGSTGSGKSTLQDMVPWILYGQTAKGGSVEDVRSWQAVNDPTVGTIEVETDSGNITITRIRGKSTQNDLYWEEEGKKIRGKDIVDTQKLLNKRLGADASLYNSAACFNEFSASGLFFLATAKGRREVFEKIANLEFPITLLEKLTVEKKRLKQEINDKSSEALRLSGKINQLQSSIKMVQESSLAWDIEQEEKVASLKNKSSGFEHEKLEKIAQLRNKSYKFERNRDDQKGELVDKIDELDEKIRPADSFEVRLIEAQQRASVKDVSCPTCGAPSPRHLEMFDSIREEKIINDRYMEKRAIYVHEIEKLEKLKNPYAGQLADAKNMPNHYDVQLMDEIAKKNPFMAQSYALSSELNQSSDVLITLKMALESLEIRQSRVGVLQELSTALKGIMIEKAIKEVEAGTNRCLDQYFDGEFKVLFEPSGTDNLSIDIQKNGYSCSYSQLSKGQRQMLKLSFAVSIMKLASNESGVVFSTLFIDEGLDGMDSATKLKAFPLFEELAKNYDSVFVVDHDEQLKEMFNNKINVTLHDDQSRIELA